MEQPTHYLTVTLGIDFTEVFSPERIQGVKFLLGAQSDEEVINALSSNILSDIESSLSRHKDFAKIAGVDLNQATTSELPEDTVDVIDDGDDGLDEDWGNEQPEQDESEPVISSSDTSEEFLDLDDLESDSDEVENSKNEDSPLTYDSYGVELVSSISDDIFKIEAFLGQVTNIFLRDYSYKDTVENELSEEITVYSFDTLRELNETVDDSIEDTHSEDYVIRFKDQQGNVKFGKRKIDKE